jgi:hypothetical protein
VSRPIAVQRHLQSSRSLLRRNASSGRQGPQRARAQGAWVRTRCGPGTFWRVHLHRESPRQITTGPACAIASPDKPNALGIALASGGSSDVSSLHPIRSVSAALAHVRTGTTTRAISERTRLITSSRLALVACVRSRRCVTHATASRRQRSTVDGVTQREQVRVAVR